MRCVAVRNDRAGPFHQPACTGATLEAYTEGLTGSLLNQRKL